MTKQAPQKKIIEQAKNTGDSKKGNTFQNKGPDTGSIIKTDKKTQIKNFGISDDSIKKIVHGEIPGIQLVEVAEELELLSKSSEKTLEKQKGTEQGMKNMLYNPTKIHTPAEKQFVEDLEKDMTARASEKSEKESTGIMKKINNFFKKIAGRNKSEKH